MKRSESIFRPLSFIQLRLGLICLLSFITIPTFAQYSFEQRSEPAGLFSTTNQAYEFNSTITTRTANSTVSNYAFTHWTINGNRQGSANGQAVNRVSMKLTGNIVAVAHYLNQNLDNDEDGTPDWYEQYLFGTLVTNKTYDGDLLSLIHI